MGKPGGKRSPSPITESIGYGREPGELKHLSSRRKRKKHRFPESWRAKGKEPKPIDYGWSGLWTSGNFDYPSRSLLERRAKEGESPVRERIRKRAGIQSTAEHVKFCGKQGGPPPKAKYSMVTDSE